MTITQTRPGRRFAGLTLKQFYITTISDTDTLVTGLANAKIVATRIISTAGGATNAIGSSTTPWDGTLAATRRHQARVTGQSTGTVTYDVGTGGGSSVLMVWS